MRKAFFLIVVSIAFSSCIKYEVGQQGPRGPQGPAGTPGRDGYGTYIDKYYFDVEPGQWRTSGTYGSKGYYCYAEKRLPALTAAVIDGGGILVYFIDDQDRDNQLPYIYPFYDRGYFMRTMRYDLKEGIIRFIIEDSDFEVPLPPETGTVQFKVVIISKT